MAHHNTLERKMSFKRKKPPIDYFATGIRGDETDYLPTFFHNCVSFLEDHGIIYLFIYFIFFLSFFIFFFYFFIFLFFYFFYF